MEGQKCFFGCSNPEGGDPMIVAKAGCIEKIIQSSQARGDDIHLSLQRQYDLDRDMTISCHRNCVCTYTSKDHISRFLKRKGQCTKAATDQPKSKILRRSDSPAFDFQQHCLFCGQLCVMTPDPCHPDCWRQVKLCRTADRGKGKKSFKDVIIDVCNQCKDDWSVEVKHRVQGALCDLHAADA